VKIVDKERRTGVSVELVHGEPEDVITHVVVSRRTCILAAAGLHSVRTVSAD
jgi:hypothetical protein